MEFRHNQAIYLQIGDHVCERILAGLWKDRDRIPSVRELSVSIEVNPNTVMRAYGHLQDLGIIFNQRGIGYFIAEGAFDKTRDLKRREFIEQELPLIFKTMDLLEVNFIDLKELYNTYKNNREKLS